MSDDQPVTISLEDARTILDSADLGRVKHDVIGRLANSIVESRRGYPVHDGSPGDDIDADFADPDDPHAECRAYAAELKHSLRGDG